MKKQIRLVGRSRLLFTLWLATILLLPFAISLGQGTSFTYQGRLIENGTALSGTNDLSFTLYSSDEVVWGVNVVNDVPITNGLFTATVDFGGSVFLGDDWWIEIGVRPGESNGTYTKLVPRQRISPTPYAIFAKTAQTAIAVVTGGIRSNSIAPGAVNSSAIADGAIQTNDLSSPLLNGTFWRLDGNSGPGHFLGTTDFRPLEFRVNNTPALRLTPSPFGPNIIGGYSSNSIRGGVYSATIAGGGEPDYPNRIEQYGSAIGGGVGNTNSSALSFIGGGAVNTIQSSSSGVGVIGGGQLNVIGSNGFVSVIAGGQGNVISNLARYSTISGGDSHIIEIDSRWATIGGGRLNRAAGISPTIAGGERNTATNFFSTVGGGLRNSAAGGNSFVAGGTVAGGSDNFAGTNASFIGGGSRNTNISLSAVIGGGEANTILDVSEYSIIGGGRQNRIQTNSDYSVISGGNQNVIHDVAGASAISGGRQNTVQTNSTHAVIGGGQANAISANANHAFIGGGSLNTNSGGGGFIGAGIANRAEHFDAIVVGGAGNVNAGYRAFIGGGEGNSISNTGPYATIGGGYANRAQGNSAAVGGGGFNNASGLNATVPGGAFSDALGDYSFATGRRAKAFHPGAFVWADSFDADFSSTSNNQFSVRAGGGVRLVTSGAGMTLDGQPVLSGIVGSTQLANGTAVRSLNSLTDHVALTAGANVTITPSGNTLQIAASFLGPVSDSQLSANIPRLNAAATFAGPVTANNVANNFSGAFAGNGGGLTNINAATVAGLGTGSFWLTGGNAGTSAGVNFLGTTDNQPLVLKVRNTDGFRIEPATNNTGAILPNLIGGAFNTIQAGESGSIIAGGRENTLQSTHGVISGGWRNRIESESVDSVIVGGQANVVSNNTLAATISGGVLNSIAAAAEYASVGGGRLNRIGARSTNAVIAGGRDNAVGTNSTGASMGGGQNNSIGRNSAHATVAGGEGNDASQPHAFVGGGLANGARSANSTIGGGAHNVIRDSFDAFGNRTAASWSSFIGGGQHNTISAGGVGDDTLQAAIGGGWSNWVFGAYGTIPGGWGNMVGGTFGLAAGHRAKSMHNGTFVWADSTAANFTSTADNQFLIRADGGVGIGTDSPAAKLHLYSPATPTTFRIQSAGTPGFGRVEFVSDPQGSANEWRPGYIQSLDVGGFTGGLGFYVNGTGAGSKFGDVEVMRVVNGNVAVAPPAVLSFGSQTRQMINLWGTQYGIGVQSSTTYFRTDNAGGVASGFAWYKGGAHNDGAQNPGGGATMMRLDGAGLTVNGVFVSSSDRNLKENFAPVSPRDVLAKVAALPITSWNFKGDTATPHVGPMAQDFHAAFGLGTDDKHIATVDADGVALAAIQGLNQKFEEQRAELREKDERLASLEKQLNELKQLINNRKKD